MLRNPLPAIYLTLSQLNAEFVLQRVLCLVLGLKVRKRFRIVLCVLSSIRCGLRDQHRGSVSNNKSLKEP